MGRPRKGNKFNGPFVGLEHHIIDALKQAGVSSSAFLVYVLLKKNHNPYMHKNNVILTYAEAQEWIAPATFARSLKELETKGFIEKIQHGGLALGRNRERSASIYKFSQRFKDGRQTTS